MGAQEWCPIYMIYAKRSFEDRKNNFRGFGVDSFIVVGPTVYCSIHKPHFVVSSRWCQRIFYDCIQLNPKSVGSIEFKRMRQVITSLQNHRMHPNEIFSTRAVAVLDICAIDFITVKESAEMRSFVRLVMEIKIMEHIGQDPHSFVVFYTCCGLRYAFELCNFIGQVQTYD